MNPHHPCRRAVTALAFSSLVIAMQLPLHAESVRATPADAFVDSIGVNIHLHYNDTIYGDFAKVKSAFAEVGVRHVRDGLVDSGWQPYFERVNELAAAGIRFTFITGLKLERIVPVAEKVKGAIEAFEGPNEVNLKDATFNPASRVWESAEFTPASLDFTFTGDLKNISSTLLQKSDGRFYLCLWQEVSSYDIKDSVEADIRNPEIPVTLNLVTPVSGAKEYRPTGERLARRWKSRKVGSI